MALRIPGSNRVGSAFAQVSVAKEILSIRRALSGSDLISLHATSIVIIVLFVIIVTTAFVDRKTITRWISRKD